MQAVIDKAIENKVSEDKPQLTLKRTSPAPGVYVYRWV